MTKTTAIFGKSARPRGHKPRGLMVLAAAALVLTGAACANKNTSPPFDGKYFRAKVDTPRGERQVFDVVVRNAGKSVVGAREAGVYEATRHCIEQFGSSDVNWTVGPDAPEANVLRGGDLVLSGACAGW